MSLSISIVGKVESEVEDVEAKEKEIAGDVEALLTKHADHLDSASFIGDALNLIIKPLAAAAEAGAESVAGPVGEHIVSDVIHDVEDKVEDVFDHGSTEAADQVEAVAGDVASDAADVAGSTPAAPEAETAPPA